MKTLIPLVYEDGVFRPEVPVNLPNGSQYQLVVDDSPEARLTQLQARFPKAFGGFPKKDADEILAIIEGEFGVVEPDDEP